MTKKIIVAPQWRRISPWDIRCKLWSCTFMQMTGLLVSWCLFLNLVLSFKWSLYDVHPRSRFSSYHTVYSYVGLCNSTIHNLIALMKDFKRQLQFDFSLTCWQIDLILWYIIISWENILVIMIFIFYILPSLSSLFINKFVFWP